MTDREVMQQALEALEALERADKDDFWREQRDAITALHTALEQQPAEQEPVATVTVMTQGVRKDYSFQALQKLPDGVNNLYTTPPQQQAEPVQENPALREWKEQGEAIMAQAGIGFRLGAWWADRPWRK